MENNIEKECSYCITESLCYTAVDSQHWLWINYTSIKKLYISIKTINLCLNFTICIKLIKMDHRFKCEI